MMVAVLLGALSLGACVDDNESASVTQLRDAKAQQLLALAEKAKAEGEAAKIQAEAEKAMADARAAYLNEMTEEAKQKFAVKLERIKAEAEAAIKKQQLLAQQWEQQLLKEANQHVIDAYNHYQTELNNLNDLRDQKLDKQYELAKYEAGLESTKAYIEAMKAEKLAAIEKKDNQIEAWKTYSGLDKSELQAERSILKQNYISASQQEQVAENAKDAAKNKKDEILGAYTVKTGETSSVAAVAAVQKFQEEGLNNYALTPSEYYYDANFVGTVSIEYIDTDNDGIVDRYLAKDVKLVTLNKKLYVVNPFTRENVTLTETTPILNVYKYTIGNEAKTLMDKYYTEKDALVKQQANQEEYLTDLVEAETAAWKAYNDAKAEFDKLETALATVTEKIDEAWDEYESLSEEATKVVEKQNPIIDDLNEIIEDPASTELEKAQAIVDKAEAQKLIEDANKAVSDALNAYNKLVEDNQKDLNRYNELNGPANDEKSLAYLLNEADQASYDVSSTKDKIESIKENIANFDEEAALWNDVVKAVESKEYADAIEGLKENADILAYVKAYNDYEDAKDLTSEVNEKISAINKLISEAYDAEEMIASLQKEREELQMQLDELNYTKFDELDGEITESLANREKMIALLKSDIENLDAQITAQEAVVEIFKANLEQWIESGDDTDTPAEETPAA